MQTKYLDTLKIHKLTQAQYDRLYEADTLDETALYLVPDNMEAATEEYVDNAILDIDLVGKTYENDSYSEIFNDYSHNVASGAYSHAEGFMTTASGEISHAEGWNTEASAGSSHAEGYQTKASAGVSHAEGYQTKASGTYSHAEGYVTEAIGSSSHTEGYSTQALSDNSHAEGTGTIASGESSHAEGRATTASGVDSHAEGTDTTASGISSHAEGYGAIAQGGYSHAEGYQTEASGYYSHAEGYGAQASGNYSHAAGYNTYANAYQTVIGKYNTITEGPSSLTDTNEDAGLFIVGIGSADDSRSNGFRVNPAGKPYALGTMASSGADYAEYFEWVDGNPDSEDRCGRFVTMDGEKIRYATADDEYILGVVSAVPTIVGDIHSEFWRDRYLRDIFGRKVYETVEVEETTDENGVVTPAHTEKRWVLNPEYDSEATYVSREHRPEWDAIGIVGKLVVIDDGTCQVNGYCYPGTDGIATNSSERTAYRVINRLDDSHVKIFIK